MSRFVVSRGNLTLQKCCFLPVIPKSSTRHHHSLSSNKHGRKVPIRTGIRMASTEKIVHSPFTMDLNIPNMTVPEYIYQNYEKNMDEPAATCASTGRGYSYGMLRMLISRFARALLGHCGMKPGEVVGLMLPNIPEYVVSIHGAMEAGCIVTFVNPLYTPDEIKRQFENAGAKMIVTIPLLLEVAQIVAPQLPGYRTTICVGGDTDEAKNVQGMQELLMADYEAELPKVDPNGIALLPYSSGTTGLPKGVKLTHRNLVANLVQGNNPAISDILDDQKEVVLSVLPFFHIYGFNGIMNISMLHGLHLVTLPRFTPEEYVKALMEYKPTSLFVVPSLLLFLASHPAVTQEHLSSVRSVTSGAAPATEGLLQKFREKLGRDDVLVRQGYGMTESSPVTLMMPKLTPPSKVGTCGVLYPGTEGKIVSLKTNETCGPHKSGELLVRGPQVMQGYLNNEKATAETLDNDGWLHTGDVAYYDDEHYFYIVDRCKELIKVKGNQVSPTELENIILELQGVADVAVVGIPDTLAGELPRAYVVRRQGAKVTADEVLEYVNPKVTSYKKLAGGVKFIESIPRNPAGKVLRNELRLVGERPAKSA